MIKDFYLLTKPGIVRGNILTAIAGFLFASKGEPDLMSLLTTVVAVALVIASGCVLNNVIDKNLDKHMKRTKNRAIAAGRISQTAGLVYGSFLGIVGLFMLFAFVNVLTFLIGILGLVFYVGVYGYVKRRSIYGTEVGTISGATSVLAGYTAFTGQIDTQAILLFLAMLVWQMPHFYSIAIFRKDEYAKAKIPLISIVKGISATKKRIVIYISVYIAISVLPTILGYTSILYGAALFIVGSYWLYKSISTFNTNDDILWAKRSFGLSLIVLLVFSVSLILDSFLA